ncbi:MAG: ATP-binding cassette domain-containing protein [Bacteroidales bacterium]|nr:ATP-binding cassette domain-containing protein [Bacteroidales bacterium]
MPETQNISKQKILDGIDQQEKVVEIRHLQKSFDGKEILEDVNLELYRGENIVVLGKSGQGKSVLIKCIIGLMMPDAGEIYVFGKDIINMKEQELNEIRKKIGFLFQSGALYDSMTVRENLAFPLIQNKVTHDHDEIEFLIDDVLESVGLLEAKDKMPSELSGGMKKRIGLARTLILKPEIILYDEPTTGLDPVIAKGISNLIIKVQEKYRTSSLIITHDIKCAKITANRMYFLKDGKVLLEGDYDDFKTAEEENIKEFFT